MSDLRGKDYLTEKEAAHYCGVCLRQLQVKRKEVGIRALLHMGKILYRRSDLVKSIEQNA